MPVTAASPGCGRRTSPGRYRCVYCLHRFELRSVCPDCGEHSTIVRMSSTATIVVQPLRRLDAASRYDPPRRAVDPVRRLRPPRASRCSEVIDAGADGHPRATSWTATSSRRSRIGPQASSRRCATRSRRRAPRRPPHDRAPRAPRRRVREAPAPTASPSTPRRRRTSTTRCRRSARPAAAPGSPSTRARRVAAFARGRSVDLALCMTVNPGWGGQAFIPAPLGQGRAACATLLGDDVAIEVDGGIDAADRAPLRRRRGRPCSSPARRSSEPPTPRAATAADRRTQRGGG